MNFKEKIKLLFSKEIFKKLCKYVDLIEKENKMINLTNFLDDKLWKEGIYESILLLQNSINNSVNNLKILDIGSGAGFPSIPFLIANPNNEVTIFEPIKKKTKFLEKVKKELNLNIKIKNIRAEDSKQKEYFDFITARAVAHINILMEISHSLGKMNSLFCFIKGPKSLNEIKESYWIINKLNIEPKIKKILIDNKENNLIIYKKEFKTPNFLPRRWKDIKTFYS